MTKRRHIGSPKARPGSRLRQILLAISVLSGCSEEAGCNNDTDKSAVVRGVRDEVNEVSDTSADTIELDELENAPEKQKDLLRRLFEEEPKIKPPEGSYNARQIEKWKNRYLNEGNEGKRYNSNLIKFKKRRGWKATTLEQDLMAGWERLADPENGHLEMVYNLCLEEQVPFELVFLALGESHWNDKACSHAGACGPWQFTGPTARAYNLIDSEGDHRADHERSTRAAIQLLKDEYDKTYAWEGKKRPKEAGYTDSRRWAWAFWAYNRGPGKVKRSFKRFNGDANVYAETLNNQGFHETAGYVNKLFGIREALKAKYEKGELGGEYVISFEDPTASVSEVELTDSDRMYENYGHSAEEMDMKDKLAALQKIRTSYQQDQEEGRHTALYVEAAIYVIDEEMTNLRLREAEKLRSEREAGDTGAVVEVDRGGEMELTITRDAEVVTPGIESYTIQPGDTLNAIAIRLSSHPNKVHLIMELIQDLNPEIKNINRIKRGDTIKVPGEYIIVPKRKLSDIVNEYYPGWRESDAIAYLKYLNGKDPKTESIVPGEEILVPAF